MPSVTPGSLSFKTLLARGLKDPQKRTLFYPACASRTSKGTRNIGKSHEETTIMIKFPTKHMSNTLWNCIMCAQKKKLVRDVKWHVHLWWLSLVIVASLIHAVWLKKLIQQNSTFTWSHWLKCPKCSTHEDLTPSQSHQFDPNCKAWNKQTSKSMYTPGD